MILNEYQVLAIWRKGNIAVDISGILREDRKHRCLIYIFRQPIGTFAILPMRPAVKHQRKLTGRPCSCQRTIYVSLLLDINKSSEKFIHEKAITAVSSMQSQVIGWTS